MTDDKWMKQAALLEEGVACARAILHAIEAGDLFRSLPATEDDQAAHNHGCWLLGMLEDHLNGIQRQVGALDASSSQES